MGDKVKVHHLDPVTQETVTSLFPVIEEFTKFGHIRCTMPSSYKTDADNFKNMAVRADDVWVIAFPRSGTTWSQELVWMVVNNFDYDTASKIPLLGRYIFLEVNHVGKRASNLQAVNPELLKKIKKMVPDYEDIVNAPSPRFLKTHIPLSLLPDNLLDTAKVVYVARDPRDVAVSFYHHSRAIYRFPGDFKTFWNLFIRDLVMHTPIFPHLKEAWALRHHPNMLFMFYEDMIKDLPTCIKRVADFFVKEPSDEQILQLCEHLDINNFRHNESVNPSWMAMIGDRNKDFVRKVTQ